MTVKNKKTGEIFKVRKLNENFESKNKKKRKNSFKNRRKYKKYKINFVRVGGANTVPDSQVRLHLLCHLPACSFRTLQTTPPPPDAERLFICACLLRCQS